MPWTKMRACTLAISLTCAVIVGAMYVSAVAYTGDFRGNEEFWLILLFGILSAIGYLVAHVRDQIVEELGDIRQEIEEYGNERETAGHVTAARATRRHIGPVDS